MRANIKEARTSAGLTQVELAETVGVTSTHISHLENGHSDPSLNLLELIADACDVEFVWYFMSTSG